MQVPDDSRLQINKLTFSFDEDNSGRMVVTSEASGMEGDLF